MFRYMRVGITAAFLLLHLVLCGDVVADNQVLAEFRSPNKSYIFDSDPAKLTFSWKSGQPYISLKITVRDENGSTLQIYEVPSGKSDFEFELKGKGFYSIDAQAQLANSTIVKAETSAVITGGILNDSDRLQSSIGLWHVHGTFKDLISAGAGWTRRMWSLKSYQQDVAGKVISQPIPIPKDMSVYKNFNWIGTLAFGLPVWMSHAANQGQEIYPPADWIELSNLAEAFARDVPVFPPYFEIYNEPEVHWKGKDQGLVRFLQTIGGAIKKIHPETQVLAPGFATIDMPRFKHFVELGVLDGMDGLVMHAYASGNDIAPEGQFIEKVVELKKYLIAIGKPDLPIFFTEFGWSTGAVSWVKSVDELTQAQYTSRSLVLLKAERVKAAIYFCLNYKTKNEGEAGFSIQHADGSPKPAFAAFANTARWLAATSDGRRLSPVPNVHLAVFSKDVGGSVAVAWSENSSEVLYLPRFGNVRMEDMMGRYIPTSAQTTVQLTPSPTFWEMSDPLFKEITQDASISIKPGAEIKLTIVNLMLPQGINQKSNGNLQISANANKGIYFLFGRVGGKWHVQPLDVN